MNRDDVIRMAREAGMPPVEITSDKPVLYPVPDAIQRFAALVAAHVRETEFKPDWNKYQQGLADGAAAEREACAKECDIQASFGNHDERFGARQCGHAIRARGQA